MNQDVWAVVNPVARGAVAARAQLADAGVRVLATTREDPGDGQARAALESGARAVVVGGGDGTVRAVARVLAGSGVELGVLPLGTANLFAHNLGLRTPSVSRAIRRALEAPARPIDVGWASWTSEATPEETREEPFLVMAGIGHDAATVDATGSAAKARLGWWSYLAAGVRHLGARPVPMSVSWDGGPEAEVDTWTVLVANAGRLPGGIAVFPAATPDDGWLDTLVVPLRHAGQWVTVAGAGLSGHRVSSGALRYGRARSGLVRPRRPQPVHLDGDGVGRVTSLRVRIQPGGLLVRH